MLTPQLTPEQVKEAMSGQLYTVTRLGSTKPETARVLNIEGLGMLAHLLGAKEAAQYLVWPLTSKRPTTYGSSELAGLPAFTFYHGAEQAFTLADCRGDLYNFCR